MVVSYLNFTDRESEVPEEGLNGLFMDLEPGNTITKIYSRIS